MDIPIFGRSIIILTLFCLYHSPSYGQKASSNLENIEFQQLAQGISQNTVTSILQDHQGFMWFGTRNGLNRYDGVNFAVYQHSPTDSTSLNNNHVNHLFEDSKGNLWVGTSEGGLNLFNRDQEIFRHFLYEEDNEFSLSDNWVNIIFEDSQNNLWIGTEHGGLNKYNYQDNYFIRYRHNAADPHSLSNNKVSTIFEDHYHQIWVGTYGGGLDMLDPTTNRFKHIRLDSKNNKGPSSNIIICSYQEDNGSVWLGTKQGLNLMTPNGKGFDFTVYQHDESDPKSLIYDIVMSISKDNYGRIWVGTQNAGLSIFDKQNQYFYNFSPDPYDPTSIGSNSIWSIYKDNRGAMWVGARNRGLNKWDQYQRKFNHHRITPSADGKISNQDVMCFLEAENGDIWIGTEGGLNYYNKETNQYTHYVHDPKDPSSIGSNAVISLLQDFQGNLWVGTWEGGLNLFHKQTGTFTRFKHDPSNPNSISGDNIFTMTEDKSGKIWIGVFYSGLDLFDPVTGDFSHYPYNLADSTGLLNGRVFKIFRDSRDDIWVGTEGGGLSLMQRFDDHKISYIHYTHDSRDTLSISSNMINSITEDSDHNLWIGTWMGLNKFDHQTRSFTSFNKEDGLPDNVVNGVIEDEQENLWVSTNQGISKFNKQTKTFKNYDIADGLQAQEFIRGSYLKSQTGELFFGGINGYNSFYPHEVRENPYTPPVYLTNFYINNDLIKPGGENSPLKHHISATDEIKLSYYQNEFHFEFAALNYSQSSKNNYSYMLEGYDKDWQYCGSQTNAHYTRVPQGEYTFKVRGTNNDGLWNQQGASLKIVITPPWWETWWAYMAYSLVLVGLFLWYRKDLINRERLQSDLRLEHMEVVKMQEMAQLRSAFFANISHEFRTPLTLILTPLKDLESSPVGNELKGKYQLMIRNCERLLSLINQLLDLSKLGAGNMKLRATQTDLVAFLKPILASFETQALNQDISFTFHHPQHPVLLYLDPEKMEEIVVNLLSNAFKFTDQGKVAVRIRPNNDAVELLVQDSGIGIPKDCIGSIFNRFYQVKDSCDKGLKGTGIGLSLTKELVELHSGSIEVESVFDVGSTFKVTLPKGRAHLHDDDIFDREGTEKEQEDLMVAEEPDDFNELSADDQPLVLVTDDNKDMREYIKDRLHLFYRIRQARNGQEALELCISESPDLVISDIIMPKMTGTELCNAIKNDIRTSHIPVILLTAKADLTNKIKGLELGADDYVTKPFDSKVLKARVDNLISSRESLKKVYSRGDASMFEPKNVSITPLDKSFMEKVLKCIEDNIGNSEFRVELLGREVGMSRMNLYRKIKSLTGQSVIEFIRTIRLKRASQLLKQSQLNISEITYQVGFNDLKYFRQCFKKEFGMSPSEYVSNNKEDNTAEIASNISSIIDSD